MQKQTSSTCGREREHQQQQPHPHGANKFANISQPAQNTHRCKACHARAPQANKHTHTHMQTIKAALPPAASLLSARDCAASNRGRAGIREAAARGSLGIETTHNAGSRF